MSAVRFRAGGSTTIGVHPNRMRNDDFLFLDPELSLFAVFDAGGSWSEMGGRAGPMSAEAIRRVVRERAGEEPRTLLGRALRAANDALLAEPDPLGLCGSASVALALIRFEQVFISWLGDAMVYRVTGERLEPLTRPHTAWNEAARRGTTPTNPALRNLLVHVLGNQELPNPLEVVSFMPQPGDRLVLTTDGVTNHIPADTILNACRVISDPTTCAEAIIEHALTAGSRDNCTCAVISFEDEDFR